MSKIKPGCYVDLRDPNIQDNLTKIYEAFTDAGCGSGEWGDYTPDDFIFAGWNKLYDEWYYFIDKDSHKSGFDTMLNPSDIFQHHESEVHDKDTVDSLIKEIKERLEILKKKEAELEITIEFDFLNDF